MFENVQEINHVESQEKRLKHLCL